jgi:hypothetical protein
MDSQLILAKTHVINKLLDGVEVGELEDEGDDGDGDVEGLETGWKLIP